MKSFIPFLLPFVGLLAVSFLTGQQIPDAALVFASTFAAGLTLWTFRQYDRRFPSLLLPRPLRLPLPEARQNPPAPSQRLAA